MKKISSCFFVIIALLLTFVSCATLQSEPTLFAEWKRTEGTHYETYIFTEDGRYVYESDDFSEFGFFEADDSTISGDIDFDYVLDGKTLILDGEVFNRVSKKAVNNSSQVAGVWENDDYIIGLAKDGYAISSGRYFNNGNWDADPNNGELTIDGDYNDYLIINNTLYLEGLDFVRDYDFMKFKKVSSGGNNKTSVPILCSQPWYYANDTGTDGTVYIFYSNGNFDAFEVVNNQQGASFNGTYYLENNIIHLGNGNSLIFAYIDDTPFGYD